MLPRDKNLKKPARVLRRNLTDAERKLWSKLRRKQLGGFLFYRQKVIGRYIVDFYCHHARLVIEVDGGQHYTDAGIQKDSRRDSFLDSLGLHVLRYNDLDVLKNCEGVVSNIMEYLLKVKNNDLPPKKWTRGKEGQELSCSYFSGDR
jgi:very-short-patch-repair endonuclease